MDIAIGLIVGFAMGCGCTVALLFCLKRIAQAVGIVEKPIVVPPDEENAQKGDKPSYEEQLANILNHSVKPKRQEKVTEDED